MGSVNQVTILGNLGADPELRFTPSGKAVCNMSVATTYKPKSGVKQTEWHRVVCWDATAENCAKYLVKGREVFVSGRLQTRSYDKDGTKRYSTEIMAERIVFVGQQKQHELPGAAADEGKPGDDDDNLAF
jgi:single-strand DNA-binding protein